MIIDKMFYKTLFKNLFSDTFELKLWDGSSEVMDKEKSNLK